MMPRPVAPKRFQDSDIARLLEHDHEEDREDTEAGDGDDQKQQHVEHGGFHLDGGQQRTFFISPRADLVNLRREIGPQQVANLVEIDALLEPNLNRVAAGDLPSRGQPCRAVLAAF